MKRYSPLMVAAGLILAVAGAVFAQSRDRRSGRDRSSRDYTSSSSNGSYGSLTPTTGPGITETSPQVGKPLPGDFEILAEKSIFERDRRPYRAPIERPPEVIHHDVTPPPPHIPAVPVLVGVIIGDDASLIAYIEDPDAGRLYPFAVGDVLPDHYGTVESIHLDGIEISSDGGDGKQILIGQTLTGNAAPLLSSSSAGTPSPSIDSSTGAGNASQPPATTGPAIDANDPNLTIEQRMKLKRQQQLGH